MTIAAASQPHAGPARVVPSSGNWEVASALYGVVIISLAQMPMFDVTGVGAIVRFTEIGVGLLIVALNFEAITRRYTPGELAFLLAYCGVLGVSTLAATLEGVNPEPAELAKDLFLNVVIYSAAKLLVTEEGFERYMRWYFLICLLASIQAVPTVTADFLGLRQMHEIPISSGDNGGYTLSWWGLLGQGDRNFRSNFYFSESSHFAHMLLPGIAYALTRRKALSLLVLLIGFLTTSAGFAGGVLAIMLVASLLRFRPSAPVAVTLAIFLIIVAAAFIILFSSSAFFILQLLDRSTSIANKVDTMAYLLVQLRDYPLGLGPINLPAHFGDVVNTSSGIFEVAGHYGFPGLGLIFGVCAFLAYLIFSRREDWRVSASALGVLAVLIATTSHGPFFKYYALFMLSATQSLRLSLQSTRAVADWSRGTLEV